MAEDDKGGVLVLATQNAKKRKELEALARGHPVRTLDELGLSGLEIVEDGETFRANAEKKARAVYEALKAKGALGEVLAVLADDSGICVDALSGAPGVRSARFAKDHGAGAGDEANNALLLQKLEGVPDEERTGRFACAICVITKDGETFIEEGTVEGRIAREERGENGFGYDPLFLPDEHPDRHLAELSSEEKHAISHRGRAMRKALARLFGA